MLPETMASVDLSRYIGFGPSTKWQTLRGSYAKVAAAAPSKPTCDDLRGEGHRENPGKEGLIQQYDAVYLSPGRYCYDQHFFQSSFFTIPCIGFGQVNNDSVKGSPSGKHRFHCCFKLMGVGTSQNSMSFPFISQYLLICPVDEFNLKRVATKRVVSWNRLNHQPANHQLLQPLAHATHFKRQHIFLIMFKKA